MSDPLKVAAIAYFERIRDDLPKVSHANRNPRRSCAVPATTSIWSTCWTHSDADGGKRC